MTTESTQTDLTYGFDQTSEETTDTSHHELATLEDLLRLELVVGEDVAVYLKRIGASVLFYRGEENTPAKGTNAGSMNIFEQWKLRPDRFSRNNFIILINDRVVVLSTFLRKPGVDAVKYPEKVAQIDFVFFKDYQRLSVFSNPYQSQNSPNDIGGTGLYSDALDFLRKIKGLAYAIKSDCVIQVACSDEKRKRIYDRALGNLPNVKFLS